LISFLDIISEACTVAAMGKRARARACANIALVKYWGKRDEALNLPAEGSLSLTLAALPTETSVSFEEALPGDEFHLDGVLAGDGEHKRLSRWLDILRARAGTSTRARVESTNGFPTASGLASSASGFAALAVAAAGALDLALDERELSIVARRGSGSAARSIFGGFARMHRGDLDDGSDSFAENLPVGRGWDLQMVICVVGDGGRKAVSSRAAMDACRETSPLYTGWLTSVPGDLRDAVAAIAARDVAALGAVAERSALTMHAAALATRPGVCFFAPGTIACMDRVRALRVDGVPAYFTMDAGPHVKVLTTSEMAATVADAMREVPGVGNVFSSGPGEGARLVD